MLSKIIVDSYKLFIEISLWLSLAVFFFGGAQAKGISGAIIGLILWFVFAVTFFGIFLVVTDIREKVKSIEASKNSV